jgi:hypothetical protein
MRQSPSIVPGRNQDVHLVLDDFGHLGQTWREANVEDTDIETVITDLFDGQYKNPVRVIAFNTSDGWSRDVSEEIARDLQQRCVDHMLELPAGLQEFVERYGGPGSEVKSK